MTFFTAVQQISIEFPIYHFGYWWPTFWQTSHAIVGRTSENCNAIRQCMICLCFVLFNWHQFVTILYRWYCAYIASRVSCWRQCAKSYIYICINLQCTYINVYYPPGVRYKFAISCFMPQNHVSIFLANTSHDNYMLYLSLQSAAAAKQCDFMVVV